jgi:hypothetical protein
MSANSTYATPISANMPAFKNGSELQQGDYVRLIAKGDGTVVNANKFLTVTDYKDRKGNPLLVDGSGATVFATPSSIWSTQG